MADTTPSVRQETITAPTGTVPNFATAFNDDIGFDTISIAVDNFTGYWMYIPDAANPFVPPFYIGVVRNLIHATTRVVIQWATPYGPSQAVPQTGSFANVTFTNYILPYTLGSLAGIPSSPAGPPSINVTVTDHSFISLPDTIVLAVPIVAPAIALPAAPLVNRRAMMIQAAETNTDFIYIGGPNVTVSRAAGAFGGVSLGPQQTYPIDTDGAISYAIAAIVGQIVIIQEGA